MKMANGTNPSGQAPMQGTRAKAAALMTTKLVEAQEYNEKTRAADGEPSKMPARNIDMETLVEVLDGMRVVHIPTNKHDDVLTAIRLDQEFGYRMVLHHVSDAWKIPDEIAAAGYPASIFVLDAPGGKLEAADVSMENGAALERAGVKVAFHTDDGVTDSRYFLRSAALAVRQGLSRESALRAMTLSGAEMLEIGRASCR